jgi:tRNA1(Val) A37 N6-methylase TrmN6
MPRKSLTEQAHQIIRSYIKQGATAIDMTAGNGLDTLQLAREVEHTGQVFSFDIQQQAINISKQLIKEYQHGNVEFFCANHAEFDQYLPSKLHGNIDIIMFNLGYLPGGNKSITTRAQNTVIALEKSLEWLAFDGVITLLVYVGHPAGLSEFEVITAWLNKLDKKWNWELINKGCSETSPRLFIISHSTSPQD